MGIACGGASNKKKKAIGLILYIGRRKPAFEPVGCAMGILLRGRVEQRVQTGRNGLRIQE